MALMPDIWLKNPMAMGGRMGRRYLCWKSGSILVRSSLFTERTTSATSRSGSGSPMRVKIWRASSMKPRRISQRGLCGMPKRLRKKNNAGRVATPSFQRHSSEPKPMAFVGRSEDLESLYLDNFYSAFSAAQQRALCQNLPAASPYANFRRYWDSKPGLSALPRLLFADQKTYLVELLMKQDQMSMATSVESRVPFLDHEFVEFSTRVPQH